MMTLRIAGLGGAADGREARVGDAAAGVVITAVAADFGTGEQVDHTAVDGPHRALAGATDIDARRIIVATVALHA